MDGHEHGDEWLLAVPRSRSRRLHRGRPGELRDVQDRIAPDRPRVIGVGARCQLGYELYVTRLLGDIECEVHGHPSPMPRIRRGVHVDDGASMLVAVRTNGHGCEAHAAMVVSPRTWA